MRWFALMLLVNALIQTVNAAGAFGPGRSALIWGSFAFCWAVFLVFSPALLDFLPGRRHRG